MAVKHVWLFVLLVLWASLGLTGCSSRAGGGPGVNATESNATESNASESNATLAIDLPALVVDVDANGTLSLEGLPLAEMALGPDLAELQLDSRLVAQLTAAQIQQIQISLHPGELLLLVNQKPIPSLRWDVEQLTALHEGITLLGPDVVPNSLFALFPLLSNVGAGIILRFPVDPGWDLAAPVAEEPVAAQPATPTAVLRIPVLYDAAGNYTVQGIRDAEWQVLTGAPFGQLKLNATLIQNAVAAGVRSVTLRTDASGLHLAFNGRELPSLNWNDNKLRNLADLAVNGLLAAGGMDTTSFSQLFDRLLPILQSSQITLHVTFPTR